MDLDELEKLAREVTPGPWDDVWADGQDVIVTADGKDHYEKFREIKNSTYMAAADPQTVLKLIEVVRGALLYKASQKDEQGNQLYPESFDDTELMEALETIAL